MFQRRKKNSVRRMENESKSKEEQGRDSSTTGSFSTQAQPREGKGLKER